MNTAQHLYETAFNTGKLLTPEQENLLDAKYGARYAQLFVGRKLYGQRVNKLIRESRHASMYSRLPRPSTMSFDTTLSTLTESHDESISTVDKEPCGSSSSGKCRMVRDILDALKDEFECHPTMLISKKDFERIDDSGDAMKDFIMIMLDDPECCQDSAERIKDSLDGTHSGHDILSKLYLSSSEHF